jgi:serine/threonine-protein kinase
MMLGDGQVHILDFGIGSLLAENEGESLVDTMSTANTMTSGLDCASPESIMEPTNRTAAGDQYSLGCCLYFFLTGRYPFPEGSAVEKMMAHQYKQPTSLKELAPEVPDELVDVVERLMQKTAEQRYSNTDEAVEALRPLASAPPPRAAAARPTSAPGGLRRPDNGMPGRGGAGRPSSEPAAPAARGGAAAKTVKGSAPSAPGKSSNPAAPAKKSSAPAAPAASGRKSLRDSIASPAPPPKRELPPEEDEEAEEAEDRADEEDVEDEEEEEEDDEQDGEGRINTTLVTVLAVIACTLAFWVALRWFSDQPIWPF